MNGALSSRATVRGLWGGDKIVISFPKPFPLSLPLPPPVHTLWSSFHSLFFCSGGSYCPASLGTIFSSSYSIRSVAMETPRLTVIKGLLSLSECQHAIPPAPGTRVLDTVHCTPGYAQLGPRPLLFLPASFPPLLACVFTGSPQRSA